MSNPDFVQYIVDQCSVGANIANGDVGSTSVADISFGDVGSTSVADIYAKKMFGDYGFYCNGKIVGLICDNNLYIKSTEAGRALLRNEDLRPPYPGAKPYFYIEDVDDRDYLAALVKATYKALPEPKPKKRK